MTLREVTGRVESERELRSVRDRIAFALEATEAGGGSRFVVSDDGPGIPTDQRDDVFAPGHTTAEDGTGIGLAIVREIAQAHGRAVEVTESERGGARFAFDLAPPQ